MPQPLPGDSNSHQFPCLDLGILDFGYPLVLAESGLEAGPVFRTLLSVCGTEEGQEKSLHPPGRQRTRGLNLKHQRRHRSSLTG